MPHAHGAVVEEGEVWEDCAMDRFYTIGLVRARILCHLGPRRVDVIFNDCWPCAPGVIKIRAMHAHAVSTTRSHLHRCRPAPVGCCRTTLDLDGRAVAIGRVIEVTN